MDLFAPIGCAECDRLVENYHEAVRGLDSVKDRAEIEHAKRAIAESRRILLAHIDDRAIHEKLSDASSHPSTTTIRVNQ